MGSRPYSTQDLNADITRLREWAPDVLRDASDPDAIREVLRLRVRVNEHLEAIDDITAFLDVVEADKACAPFQDSLLLIPFAEASGMGLLHPSAWFGVHLRQGANEPS